VSISQDYWGDIKEDPRKLKLFCETTRNICVKIQQTQQQLLLLLDKINLAAKYTFENIFFTFNFSSTKIQQIQIISVAYLLNQHVKSIMQLVKNSRVVQQFTHINVSFS